MERSSNVVIGHNNFDRNPRYLVNGFDNAEKNGLLFLECDDCVLSANTISGVWKKLGAVQFINCNRCNITGNSILDSDGVGLLLKKTHYTLVTGNLIRDDRELPSRSKSPSLELIESDGNVVGPNVLGNGSNL